MAQAEVDSVTRETDEGVRVTVIKAIPNGEKNPATYDHFSAPGDDSPPLPGDFLTSTDSPGVGNEDAVGYFDPKMEPKAQPGEKRVYARNSAGDVVGEMWLQGDATITIENSSGKKFEMDAAGDVTITGNLIVHGEVTAMAASPGTSVKVSTHVHPHPMGPTSAPTPGT